MRMPRSESMPVKVTLRMRRFESSPAPELARVEVARPTPSAYTGVTITDSSAMTHFGSVLACVSGSDDSSSSLSLTSH